MAAALEMMRDRIKRVDYLVLLDYGHTVTFYKDMENKEE